MANLCAPEKFGADPVNIQWRVIRGDTATLRVEFYEDDEQTYYDTEGWIYKCTAYDQFGDVLDSLDCQASDGYVDIKADPELTVNWGTGYQATVAELPFDVQVIIDDVVWTPVIGTIYVIGDVTPGGSL